MNAIAKGPADPDRFRHRCLFYNTAREGFADLLVHVGDGSDLRVALPAFIGWSPHEGSGVFDPVLAASADGTFYGLNDDLTIDMVALDQALSGQSCRVLVVIHYFGRTQPQMEAVRQIAQRHGVILVEDLAHGFYSWAIGGGAGRWGDVSLFSLHKMLPRNDGGMALYRDASLITGQRETAPELARFVVDYDWFAIAQTRRANFTALLTCLGRSPLLGSAFRPLWGDLAQGDVPQTLPVRILSGDRDAIYHRMNAEGFGMTSLYHTLIDEVRDAFPAMIALSRSIINFPIHQDIDPHAIEAMAASFEAALGATA